MPIRRLLASAGLILAGCAPTAAPPTTGQLPAYSDGAEYFVPTMRGPVSRAQVGTAGVTHYFQINSKHICYSFEVPGVWRLGREPGVLRRLDDQGMVGILFFGIAELGGGSADNAIRKAAERSGELYAKERAGAPWSLTPYPGSPGVCPGRCRRRSRSSRDGTCPRTAPGSPSSRLLSRPRWWPTASSTTS